MMRLRRYSIELALAAVLAGAVAYFAYLGYGLLTPTFVVEPFSGARALQYATQQVEFGPRPSGSPANLAMGDWMIEELRNLGWDVVVQPFTAGNGAEARNIIAIRSPNPAPARSALLMTHYDTRLRADRDPDPANHDAQPLGANAGASGTAVLLELARSLDIIATGHTVCLIFLDGEENDGIAGWEAAMGSAALIQHLDTDIPRCRTPRFALYVDMVGNVNQRLYTESTSYVPLTRSLWGVAAELGFGNWFINEPTWTATDAHTRFREINIPAATLSDYNYPHRDTLSDGPDQLSVDSLDRVGMVLKTWLERGAPY